MKSFTHDAQHKNSNKDKVLFIMGSTGSGKSKLSLDIASYYRAEIINSDKIQIYKGLDIVTNKLPESERRNIPHHLLDIVDPDKDFTAEDFCHHARAAINRIIKHGRLPIIVGGSNTYIAALVQDSDFLSKYECCFICVEVSLSVLFKYLSERVDQMVQAGLVDEIRDQGFVPGGDYSHGIRTAIGVPEMDKYFRVENDDNVDEGTKQELLRVSIKEIKDNTYELACRQIQKIFRLRDEVGWNIHRIDATCVFEKNGMEADEAWMNSVVKPSLAIVGDFLKEAEQIFGEMCPQ